MLCWGWEIPMFLFVSVTVSLAWHERRARALYQQTEQGQGNDQGREKAKKMTKSRNKLKWAQIRTRTHTHTYCANPMPVNCSVLESLERHQRAWAASCSELLIPSWLNVDAWPSRLDQPLIHSLGPGNYWVSTEPHAATNNTHSQTCTCTQRGAWLVHRNARHAYRPYCHENRQSCSQIQRRTLPKTQGLGIYLLVCQALANLENQNPQISL